MIQVQQINRENSIQNSTQTSTSLHHLLLDKGKTPKLCHPNPEDNTWCAWTNRLITKVWLQTSRHQANINLSSSSELLNGKSVSGVHWTPDYVCSWERACETERSICTVRLKQTEV
ncbi:hypothetical protein BaRGS_00015416 [Batillaria attramentaria]|uniref:Uncharacterized protein n=1 Tax=Batillaria attramentaria TaxID=370345 RepID=A0ABD0L1W2_9CAEN